MNTFKEAYGVLTKHAQTLRNQQEPNIDDLLAIVTQSVDAYKVCKQRIDAVEQALERALSDPAAAATAPRAADENASADSGRPAGPDGEDDIPF